VPKLLVRLLTWYLLNSTPIQAVTNDGNEHDMFFYFFWKHSSEGDVQRFPAASVSGCFHHASDMEELAGTTGGHVATFVEFLLEYLHSLAMSICIFVHF
jgi:hypothetical protein